MKLFDVSLDHWPTYRVPVLDAPATAAEVLELVSADYRKKLDADFAALAKPTDNQKEAYREAVQCAVATAGELKAIVGEWSMDNPGKSLADFQAAFAANWVAMKYADRFAAADAIAEYKRLYGLESSHNPFLAVEVQPGTPPPPEESDGWKALRKQEGLATWGTERKADWKPAKE